MSNINLNYCIFLSSILENINNAMALTWTQKQDYPILKPSRLSNEKFTFGQSLNPLYSIPINVVSENKPQDLYYNLILNSVFKTVNLSTTVSGSWYIVNYDRFGISTSKQIIS